MEALVDKCLTALLRVKDFRPGVHVNLPRDDIIKICHATREQFMKEPVLIQTKAPVVICGDIHGQYYDLLRTFEENGYPPKQPYVFMGDYVDRGKFSIEVITLLFALKLKHPDKVTVLRGNHECENITQQYGFYDECKRRYDIKLWRTFVDVFNCMPLAAVVSDRIFCVHGGLSPDLDHVEDINKIQRPTAIPDDGVICDLLWSDPEGDKQGWTENDRGVSYVFGCDVVERFTKINDLDLICRAHQVVEEGYEFACKRKLITVFTAPDYVGDGNAGAVLVVDKNLKCKLNIMKLKPKPVSAMKKPNGM